MSKVILHIDDEAPIREILASFLTEKGFRVLSVSSTAEALAAIAQTPPDLIISDLQLDEADGLETIGRLKEVLPNAPVILLTGVLLDPGVARQTIGGNVSAYLPKTSSLTRILDEVRRLAGS